MDNFEIFLSALLNNPSSNTVLEINGVKHSLKGITKLSSLNYRQEIGYYYKVFFTDPSVLIIIPSLKIVQFSAEGDLGAIENVKDSDIGSLDSIEYDGRKFHLENANDYQYTLELVFGNYEDVEGECSFSDYTNINDENDSLSLGKLLKNSQRADVNAHTLNINQVKVIN